MIAELLADQSKRPAVPRTAAPPSASSGMASVRKEITGRHSTDSDFQRFEAARVQLATCAELTREAREVPGTDSPEGKRTFVAGFGRNDLTRVSMNPQRESCIRD